MEINWFKGTIDELCEDNAVLHQNVADAVKVIEELKGRLQM